MRRPLDMRFKGARHYVHGTDMVNAAMREVMQAGAVREVENLVFVINRTTGRNLELVLGEEAAPGPAAVATLRYEVAGGRQRALLVERDDAPTGRYPYDEDGLRACCRIDAAQRSIVLERASPFTPVETMVAMTKALHLALYADRPAAWLFGRLEAPCWPPAASGPGLAIRLVQSVGTRLTKSCATFGADTLAWIYFALKEAA